MNGPAHYARAAELLDKAEEQDNPDMAIRMIEAADIHARLAGVAALAQGNSLATDPRWAQVLA